MEIVCPDAEATRRAGEALGGVVQAGDVLALIGDLGAGKTTLVHGLARGLGVRAAWVQSPTFTIVNQHRGRVALVHVDLYRLDDAREMVEIGIGETLRRDDAVVAVEWWPRLTVAGLPVPEHLAVTFSGDDTRVLTLRPVGERAAALAAAWLEAARRPVL